MQDCRFPIYTVRTVRLCTSHYFIIVMDPLAPSTSHAVKPFSSACKTIIYNVVKFCEKEALNGNLSVPIYQTTKRASEIAGVSESTIKRLRRESKGEDKPKFKSPKKRLKKKTVENVCLDNFDLDIIRRTIHEIYAVQKMVPTVSKLIPILKEKINFRWQRETLRKILHEIGFCFKESQSKRRLIMEQNDIVLSRTQYLRAIRHFREEKRPIVYVNATLIDSNLTFSKCWQNEDERGVFQTGNASHHIIILCAGGEMGFIPNSNLLYKVSTTAGDYHVQMNSKIFEKWAEEKLIPNLPKNAVVIIDNAPYHSIQLNKVPDCSSRKQDIVDWLVANNISHSQDMRKIELLDLVKRNAPKTKVFKFDTVLKEHGFLALRLPPYHFDINALEYVWVEVKNYIHLNVTGDIDMSNLFKITEQAINSVTVQNWKKYCLHVVSLENTYWLRDGIIEELCEPLFIPVSGSDDSDTDSDDYYDD